MDTRTEAHIQKKRWKLSQKIEQASLSLIDYPRLKNADLIFSDEKNGDIIEKGTHQELLQAPTLYASLYNSQFQTTLKRTGTSHSSFDSFQFFLLLRNIEFPLLFLTSVKVCAATFSADKTSFMQHFHNRFWIFLASSSRRRRIGASSSSKTSIK